MYLLSSRDVSVTLATDTDSWGSGSPELYRNDSVRQAG